MKNNKSLYWGLAGLAVIILFGIYLYNQEQERRLTEAETANRMTAVQQVDGTKKPAAEQNAVEKLQETAAAEDKEPAAEKATETAAREAASDKPAETAATGTSDEPADTKSAGSEQASEEKPLETAALDTSSGTGNNAGVVQPDAQDAIEADMRPPQFDLLRVEPDGSTVIAGQAKPGGKLEVVAGDKVLVETKIGPNRDFAAVLDEPLPPGDHEITLRVVEDGKIVSRSEEVATVSVPKDDPASLMVMVTRPGEASRILTQPKVAAAPTGSGKTSAASKPPETASAETTEQPRVSDDQEATAEPQTTGEPKPAMAAEQSTETAKADTKPTASAKVEQRKDKTDTASSSRPPAANEDPQQSAKTEVPTAAPTDETSGTKEKTQTAALTEKVEDRPAKDSRTSAAVPDARLRIDAVEIENGKVFVAGSVALAGATVRVYANGVAIGDGRVSRSGRFLVEAARDITVGQHIFNADLMMPGSDAATLRVAVLFTRPQGDMVSGVAAPEKPDSSAADGAQQKSADTASTGSETTPQSGTVQLEEQGSADDRDSARVANADTASSEPPTVMQPALEPADSSVIIRRGDTLWQISQRVYGRGVRYTTIYLANTEQIDNPDFIEPGQVFMVPDEPLANAEELHWERIRKR